MCNILKPRDQKSVFLSFFFLFFSFSSLTTRGILLMVIFICVSELQIGAKILFWNYFTLPMLLYRVFGWDGLFVHGHCFGLFSSALFLGLLIPLMWVGFFILLFISRLLSVKGQIQHVYLTGYNIYMLKSWFDISSYGSKKKSLTWKRGETTFT